MPSFQSMLIFATNLVVLKSNKPYICYVNHPKKTEVFPHFVPNSTSQCSVYVMSVLSPSEGKIKQLEEITKSHPFLLLALCHTYLLP